MLKEIQCLYSALYIVPTHIYFHECGVLNFVFTIIEESSRIGFYYIILSVALQW